MRAYAPVSLQAKRGTRFPSEARHQLATSLWARPAQLPVSSTKAARRHAAPTHTLETSRTASAVLDWPRAKVVPLSAPTATMHSRPASTTTTKLEPARRYVAILSSTSASRCRPTVSRRRHRARRAAPGPPRHLRGQAAHTIGTRYRARGGERALQEDSRESATPCPGARGPPPIASAQTQARTEGARGDRSGSPFDAGDRLSLGKHDLRRRSHGVLMRVYHARLSETTTNASYTATPRYFVSPPIIGARLPDSPGRTEPRDDDEKSHFQMPA
jgi:hypothetical protein